MFFFGAFAKKHVIPLCFPSGVMKILDEFQIIEWISPTRFVSTIVVSAFVGHNCLFCLSSVWAFDFGTIVPSLCLFVVIARRPVPFAHEVRSLEPDAVLLILLLVGALISCLLGDGLFTRLGARWSRFACRLRDFSLVAVLVVRTERDLVLVVLFLGLLGLESDLVLLGA